MKKIVFLCAAACLLAIAAKAQVTTSAGVKLQANYSKYRLSGVNDADPKYGLGAGVGGFLKIEFGEYFAIQPELLFNLNRSKIKNDGSTKYRYMGVEIPVYAVGQIDAGAGKLFLGAGPYASYGISNKAKNGTSVNLYKKQEGSDKASMERFDYGAGGMLGYEFDGGFMVNAGYRLGLRNLNKAGGGASAKTSAFTLGVGMKF